MQIQVTTPEWLKLSVPTRQRLVEIFEINRSQGTMVEGNVVVSDGYTHKDLEVITVEKMQNYLEKGFDSETGFVELFEAVVAKVEAEVPKVVKTEDMTKEEKAIEEWATTLGRIKSAAVFLKLEPQLHELISKIIGIAEKADSDGHKETGKPTKGVSAKRRGRPAANKGTNRGDKPTTEVGQGSDTPDPAQAR